ncbi:MAG: O-antigen ligase family protein [Bacteroidaceae bacterium]|nr:O-antigen ligase family protein [Bacteroidaceae bacterium]
MGAILCIILAVCIYAIKIVHNSNNLTFDKWCEIFISFFIFTNCFNFGFSYFSLGNQYIDGALGMNLRLEVFMIITPIFFIVLSQRKKWNFLPIPWYVVFAIALFCAVNIFNPNNLAVGSTIVGILQVLLYIVFLYIVCSSVSIEVIMRGIYEGFVYTIILQSALTLCYPILGIKEVTLLFREGVSIRAEERPGAPGTFSHPNALGGYVSLILAFFWSCILYGYQRRKSIVCALLATFVLIFTFSRSALLASIFAVAMVYLIYNTRNGSIFTVKNIFYRIIPIIILAVALIFLTPIKDSFIGSNVDEMFIARLMHFYCAYEAIIEHPFIGVGFNAHLEYIRSNVNPSIFAMFDKTVWNPEEFMFSNPVHNIFLIFLTEFGFIGFMPILYFIIRKFANIKKQLRRETSVEYHICAIFAIGILCYLMVHGMSDWVPLTPRMRNIWLLIFFIVACAEHKTEQKDTNKKALPH